MDELNRILSDLGELIEDLNLYNEDHFEENTKEAKQLETIYKEIQNSKEDLECFVDQIND